MPAQHVIDVGATTVLPGLAGIWTVMAAHYVNDVLVAVDARRVDARPGGDEAPPIPMRCQGCGDDIAEGSPFFERVADGCPFCRSCAVENAAGDDPDEMRTGEWVEASSAEPLLPADHPLATRPRRDDAVGLVREPFVPSARAAAETVAEMARLRCKTIVRPAIYLAEARAAMADGRPGFLRDGANGLCVVQDVREIGDDKIEIDLSPFASTPIEEHAARELERLLPGLAHDIEMVTELRHESQRSSPIQRLARAAELLTRDRERLTKRVAKLEQAVRQAQNGERLLRAQYQEQHGARRTAEERVAELEAAGRVTASLAKDFAAQAAAEQSIRNWLRAHGHDLSRPWDEVVIALLEAPPVGSVAEAMAQIDNAIANTKNATPDDLYTIGSHDAYVTAARILRSAIAPSPIGTRDLYVPSEEHRTTEPLCAALARGGATKDEAIEWLTRAMLDWKKQAAHLALLQPPAPIIIERDAPSPVTPPLSLAPRWLALPPAARSRVAARLHDALRDVRHEMDAEDIEANEALIELASAEPSGMDAIVAEVVARVEGIRLNPRI